MSARIRMMVAVVAALWAGQLALAQEACKISRSEVDGQEILVMENAYVSLTLAPSRGGECSQFVYKPTHATWTSPQQDAFVLGDHVWYPLKGSDDWEKTAYKATVLKETPEEISIELTGQGKTADLTYCNFHKTITLTRGSCAVRVHYAFEVTNEAMSPQSVGLWFHNRLFLGGQKITSYLPAKNGVKSILYDPAAPAEDYWEYDPSRGWMGGVSETGSGFGARMEYRRVMCFYEWFSEKLMTMEWMFRIATIPNQSKLETDVVLVPFDGLSRLDGVGVGGAAAITPPAAAAKEGAEVKARLFLAEPVQDAKVVWSWRKPPEMIWRECRSMPLTADKPGAVDADLSWKPEGDGIYGLRLQVVKGDSVLVEAETPLIVGDAKGEYAMLPEADRLGDPKDHFGKVVFKAEDVEIPWRFDVVTPHVPWAKPYAKGKTRALILMHWANSREIIELAERMDLDFDAPFIGNELFVGDAYRKYNPDIMGDLLMQRLKKTGYDVIIVSGLDWNGMPKGATDLLREQVKKGVGLVYIAPQNLPDKEDWTMLGVNLAKRQVSYPIAWQPLRENAIVSGVPTEVLPATGVLGYEPTGGTVFLTAKSGAKVSPLGVARENAGGQRTVVFNYVVSRVLAGWGDCLTPFIRNPKERFDYWEYHYSLLAKAVLWAARREPDVALALTVEPVHPAFGVKPINVVVAITGSTADMGRITAECVLRDGYWAEVARKSLDLTQAPKASFAIEQSLPAGLYFVDAIVRCQGKAINWGSVAFRVTGNTMLTSFELPGAATAPLGTHYYRTGMEVAPVAKVRNAKAGMFLQAEFSDNLGRLLARKDVPVPAGDNVEVKVPFAVDRPLTTVGYVRVALKDAARVYDRSDVNFVMLPENYVSGVWDDFEWIPWGAMGDYDQEYLIPTKARVCHDAGLTLLLPSASENEGPELLTEHESSIRAGYRVIECGLWDSDPNREQDRQKYAETHDKKYLERKPSLSDPAYKEQEIKRVKKWVTNLKPFVPLAWMWGDEQSVNGDNGLDYDFSPVALKDFREMLKKDYGTLDALNKEWKTKYATWDEAVPLTGSEARAAKNYAPWSDHRTFMERSYTGFFAMLQKALQEECPDARTGLCGTQAPTAYNGCDWTLFSDIFRFVQPYYYNGQAEIHTSLNQTAARTPWATGYSGVYPGGARVWEALLRGDRGVGYFALSSYLNPDFTYTKSCLSVMPAVKAIEQSGLAKLFIGDACYYDPIAVLHSQRSIHGAYIINREWYLSHEGWFQSLYDLGYCPKLISYEQLDAGELTLGKYKVCILPMTTAISERQADLLRKYVEAGGVLLTDHHTGIFDGHCAIATPGMLDRLFGIRHTAFNAEGAPAQIRFTKNEAVPMDLTALSLNSQIPEGGLTLDGGQALGQVGGVPYAVFNAPGKGWTCYLNIDMGKYVSAREIAVGDFYRGISAALMNRVGLKPAWRIEPAMTASLGFWTLSEERLYAFTDGDARFMGFVRPLKDAKPREIILRDRCHVYDCQDGTYFGETDRFTPKSLDRAADIFALLPYKVSGLKIASSAARPGERVSVPISVTVSGLPAGAKPVRHVVHVAVLRPDGTEAAAYSANVALANGQGALVIPFALNDPAGAWTLKARDAATCVTAEAEVQLAE